jgi:hypothetical protein
VLSPEAGSTVSGLVTVHADANDNVAVTALRLSIDGALVNTGETSAAYSWDTTAATNGAHLVRAHATDAAGNESFAEASVTVNNVVADTTVPSVQITRPQNGFVVTTRQFDVEVSATDNVAVDRVELYVDRVFAGSVAGPTAVFKVNASKWKSGSHVLQAFAFDAAGNQAASTIVHATKYASGGGSETGGGSYNRLSRSASPP